jgi:hypothetical protein
LTISCTFWIFPYLNLDEGFEKDCVFIEVKV